MTNQQQADQLLAHWQSLRPLPPDERIERLMAEFFSPLPPCQVEYEATLNRVREEMA
jgi:hypothetical protein